ncbi:uncharacterized mitochondrial protein AtMg00810-like [Pyrus communis]|uniref:uncharacterized mitochondrial protein AtMg00810-like n=1 Tax=Pyrus communis TaxID=23211 RepID=UPI0035C0986D
MENCRPAPTPSKPHTQLLISEGQPLPEPSFYRSIVRAFQYLTFTRPDIAHSVNVVCQCMKNPTDANMFFVKMILRYLQGTLKCGITYHLGVDIHISAYSDVDWASDINTRRLVTGYVVFLGSNPISWQSKKQSSKKDIVVHYISTDNRVADILTKGLHSPVFVKHCINLSLVVPSCD